MTIDSIGGVCGQRPSGKAAPIAPAMAFPAIFFLLSMGVDAAICRPLPAVEDELVLSAAASPRAARRALSWPRAGRRWPNSPPHRGYAAFFTLPCGSITNFFGEPLLNSSYAPGAFSSAMISMFSMALR